MLSRRLARIEDSMEKFQKEVFRQLGRLSHLHRPQAGSAPGLSKTASTGGALVSAPRGLAQYRLQLQSSLQKLEVVNAVASTVINVY